MWVYVHENNGYYNVARLKDMVGPFLGIFVPITVTSIIFISGMMGTKGLGIGGKGRCRTNFLLAILLMWKVKLWRFSKT
eukprot:scaffold61787_cov27-Tisochrysis_lutea.AAC.1